MRVEVKENKLYKQVSYLYGLFLKLNALSYDLDPCRITWSNNVTVNVLEHDTWVVQFKPEHGIKQVTIEQHTNSDGKYLYKIALYTYVENDPQSAPFAEFSFSVTETDIINDPIVELQPADVIQQLMQQMIDFFNSLYRELDSKKEFTEQTLLALGKGLVY